MAIRDLRNLYPGYKFEISMEFYRTPHLNSYLMHCKIAESTDRSYHPSAGPVCVLSQSAQQGIVPTEDILPLSRETGLPCV